MRRFRTFLSTLKKAGLVSSKIDARSAKPTPHLKSVIKEFRGVIDGRQRTVELPKKFLAIAKEDGKTVRNGHVVIENNPGMKVIKDSKDPYGYRISHPARGYEMIEHRGPRGKSLTKYIEYAESQMEPGGYIGFTVDGFRSQTLYSSVAEAVAAFERYNTMKYGSMRAQSDLASTFTIYRVPKRLKWQWKPSVRKKTRNRK